MERYLNTPAVARILDVSVSLLAKAIWSGRVNPPQKSPSGHFLWTDQDIERASWQLLGRASKPSSPPDQQVLQEMGRLNAAIDQKRRGGE